ncbi:MAG: DMT family transporter [Ghiorsea sp.]|nr:DMT family transporter [Ghiorsea sp.]
MKLKLQKNIAYMVIGSLMFACLGALIKAVPHGLPNQELVFLRNMFALFIITPFFIINPSKVEGVRVRRLYFLKVVSGLLAMYCYYYTLTEVSLVQAVLLNNTSPLFIPLIAMLLLGERLSKLRLLYLCGGFVGIALIVAEAGSFSINHGVFIGLLSGFFLAISSVSVSALSERGEPIALLFYFMLITTLCSLVLIDNTWFFPSDHQMFILLLAGLVTVVGSYFSVRALLAESANVLAALQFLTVPFSLILGIVFWDEVATMQFFIGAILIFIFAYLNTKEGAVKRGVSHD